MTSDLPVGQTGLSPLVVSFVGSSGVGKTTVLEQLIPLLRASGLRVGTVKHAPHGHEVDKVGSDSWRHRQAGADAVVLAGSRGTVLFLPPDPAERPAATGTHHAEVEVADLDRVADTIKLLLGAVDVVLIEGFAPLHGLVVELQRQAIPPKAASLARPATPVWLTIADGSSNDPDTYTFDELALVAARIAAVLTSV